MFDSDEGHVPFDDDLCRFNKTECTEIFLIFLLLPLDSFLLLPSYL